MGYCSSRFWCCDVKVSWNATFWGSSSSSKSIIFLKSSYKRLRKCCRRRIYKSCKTQPYDLDKKRILQTILQSSNRRGINSKGYGSIYSFYSQVIQQSKRKRASGKARIRVELEERRIKMIKQRK